MADEFVDRKEKCPLCKKRQIKVKCHAEGDYPEAMIKCFDCLSIWLLPEASEVDRILDEAAYVEMDIDGDLDAALGETSQSSR